MDDPVAQQYERWAWPDPAIGIEHRVCWNDPSAYAFLYWPSLPPRADLDVLVAGCGTSEAAALALRNPAARVVGIDVSAAALAHQRALASAHGIGNLTLVQLPLEQVAALGQAFDFVSVAGVLHHLADPARGLAALGAVLRPSGVVCAAVYGAHARAGVRVLQDLFRALGLGRAPSDVAAVRATLAALPPHHPAQAWLAGTGERAPFDSHVVDTWLPARDTAYDVPGVLDLVRAAGLTFQGWFTNAPYHPDGQFPPEHPLFGLLDGLEPPHVWAAMERVSAPLDHLFVACRPDRPDPWRLDFDADDLLDAIPGRRFPPGLRHPPLPWDPRDAAQEALYRTIDGQASVRACIARSGLQGPPALVERWARRFLRHLWRKDAIYLRK